jgi:hypothetical protein
MSSQKKKSTGRTSRKVVIALLSDSTLPQYEVYKKLVWERGWGGGRKSDEDVYEVIIMDDSLRKLLPDLVILIEIEGVQWLETATCEKGFSLRTQILTAQRYMMMMPFICSFRNKNEPTAIYPPSG